MFIAGGGSGGAALDLNEPEYASWPITNNETQLETSINVRMSFPQRNSYLSRVAYPDRPVTRRIRDRYSLHKIARRPTGAKL